MNLCVNTTRHLAGDIVIPASKSHTIRAVLIASLAEGRSVLHNPLFSEDTKAAINACRLLGAHITRQEKALVIHGWGASPRRPDTALDMLNSGTTTNLFLGVLAALGVEAVVTGDTSLCSRPVSALTQALTTLGCTVAFQTSDGVPPLRIGGRMHGGTVKLDASKSSQYVSSLLLACPLCPQDTEITVMNPTELPYIDMTLQWLDDQSIRYERTAYHHIKIYGGQAYRSFEKEIPADWSSATFPLIAAAVTESDVLVRGVATDDVQGDKAVVDYLERMGASISRENKGLRVRGRPLRGNVLDINATPDALPALAVLGCFAEGETTLHNVAQARVKETDRIAVMAEQLRNMGADIRELPDGLVVIKSSLQGSVLSGYNDHRVVMALSIAGLMAEGTTTIGTAEAVSVTYPEYVQTMISLGAQFTLHKEDA